MDSTAHRGTSAKRELITVTYRHFRAAGGQAPTGDIGRLLRRVSYLIAMALNGHSSGASMRWSTRPPSLTPGSDPKRVREGKRGTSLHPARPAHTPRHRLFGKATPRPEPSLRPT